jgi:hypothetical protein
LTTVDLGYLRTVMIRDDFDEAVRPIIAVSRYNQANKRRFVENVTLQEMLDRIINDSQVSIEQAWTEKRAERLNGGDQVVDAETAADALQVQVLLSMLASEVFEMMLRDRGYRDATSSVGSDSSDEFQAMRDQIEKWNAFAQSQSGTFGFVDLYRY